MEKSSVLRSLRVPVYCVPAAVLLVALCIVPTTGWMARTQFSMLFVRPNFLISLAHDLGVKQGLPDGGVDPQQVAAAQRAVLAQHPNDVAIQKAGALALPPEPGDRRPLSTIRVERMIALEQRFPDQPMIYADQLRYAAQGEVGVGRGKEQQELTQLPGSTKARYPAVDKQYQPDALARYDAAAAAGERIDPENAYFPFMRSIGLFAMHRDAEALEAVHRASQKPRWNDYCAEEARGQDRVHLAAFGAQGAVARLALNAAILFPHYAQLRAVARMVMVDTVAAEQAGQREQGLAYRHNLMRLGALMRVQSTNLIGSLVGNAIESIATMRPGGVLPTELSNDQPAKERQRAFQDRYLTYLNSIGHPEEAKYAAHEFEAGDRMKQISEIGMKKTPVLQELTPLTLHWFLDLITLYNLFWLALLGGAALLLASRGVSGRQATPILLGAFLVVAMVALQNGGLPSLTTLAMFQTVVNNLVGSDSASASPQSQLLNVPGIVNFASGVLAVCLPLLLFVVTGIICLIRRQRYGDTLLRLLPTVGLAGASLLAVVYVGAVMQTLRLEQRVNTAIERTQQHEGRYFAELAGDKWPE